MDKMTFASYKFKPSDVIEGLNRYFAESKAFRYRRVPLNIRNGEVKPGNYYVLRNIVFYVDVPKVKELGYYYVICDPEEVVGAAINWLREEHDIFYTPGMEAPKEDFNVDETAKKYEKATRKDLKEALQGRLHEAKRRIADLEKSIAEKDIRIEGLEADIAITNRSVKEQREFITKVTELLETRDPYIEREYTAAINALSNIVKYPNRYKWLYENLKDGMEIMLQEAEERKVREALGIAEDLDIFECIKYRNHQLDTLRTELVEARRMYHNAIEERNKFGRRLMDIRNAAGMSDDDHTDLVEYIETLRKSEAEYEHLYKQYEKMYCELRDAKFTKLSEERDYYKWLYEKMKNANGPRG